MKLIDNYFFEDDFKYEEKIFYGVPLFCDGKHIYLNKEHMFHETNIGRECLECGNFIEKNKYQCELCAEKKAQDKYNQLPVVDETKYLYSDTLDIYFEHDDWSEIYSHLSELSYDEIISMKFEDLRMHPCEEYYPSTIDIDCLFDEAPEEFDLDSYSPIVELNECIDRANEILSNNSIGYMSIMNKRISISEEAWLDIKRSTIEEMRENQ